MDDNKLTQRIVQDDDLTEDERTQLANPSGEVTVPPHHIPRPSEDGDPDDDTDERGGDQHQHDVN